MEITLRDELIKHWAGRYLHYADLPGTAPVRRAIFNRLVELGVFRNFSFEKDQGPIFFFLTEIANNL
jgi:hypothetical protein